MLRNIPDGWSIAKFNAFTDVISTAQDIVTLNNIIAAYNITDAVVLGLRDQLKALAITQLTTFKNVS